MNTDYEQPDAQNNRQVGEAAQQQRINQFEDAVREFRLQAEGRAQRNAGGELFVTETWLDTLMPDFGRRLSGLNLSVAQVDRLAREVLISVNVSIATDSYWSEGNWRGRDYLPLLRLSVDHLPPLPSDLPNPSCIPSLPDQLPPVSGGGCSETNGVSLRDSVVIDGLLYAMSPLPRSFKVRRIADRVVVKHRPMLWWLRWRTGRYEFSDEHLTYCDEVSGSPHGWGPVTVRRKDLLSVVMSNDAPLLTLNVDADRGTRMHSMRSGNSYGQLQWLGTIIREWCGGIFHCPPEREWLDAMLFKAVEAGKWRALAPLVREGASVNGSDGEGWSPLHIAARKGRLRTARELVRLGAQVDELRRGIIPWHAACQRKDRAMAQLLFDLLQAQGSRPPELNDRLTAEDSAGVCIGRPGPR